MSNQNPEKLSFPEQLQESRIIGDLPASALPWMGEAGATERIAVSEAIFPDGTIYIASAIPKKLAGLTEQVRKKDPYTSPDGRYTRLDEFLLQAAHLEANGQAVQSSRIHLLRGKRAADYADVTVKSFGESPKPNVRRMYYVQTRLESFRGKYDNNPSGFMASIDEDQINYQSQVIIRLGYADKHNQLEFLAALTGRSRRDLVRKGEGAV
jgi:hypothetical protein